MDFRYARPPPSAPQQPWPPQHTDQHLPPPPPYAAGPPPPPVPYNYSHPNRPPLPQAHYTPVNQEWSNTTWGHQAWDYSAQNKNEDDWAARARAWAASKTVTDDQQQQQQPNLVPASRPEEINYQSQYSQNPDPPYPEYQQNSHPPAIYQQYPSFPPPPRPPANQFQEPSFNSGYAADGQFSYPARDGNFPNSAAAYSHQDNGPTSLSGHQQEVPSSYSSVAGKEEPRDMNGQSYQPSHMHFAPAPQHQVQPSISPNDRSMSIEQPHYAYNNSSAEPTTDLSNQPLDFGPRYGHDHDHDPYGQSTYGHESGGSTGELSTATAIPPINAWNASATPGMPYPSIPPVHPTGQQADLSPASMHSAPLFGGMAGSGFQPGMPSANTAFPIGTSNAFNATNAFPGDTYGIPGFSERPKKASVPNWLKEEIIKKKPFIGSSAPGLSRQDTESNEDDDMYRPLGKGEQVDEKSMESSRSTEEESEDEDQVEAARTAVINQEIKRILTEVLLKVTDELFDEIATQVIEEDDRNVEVGPKAVTSRDAISVSSSAATTPKSFAKVLIPAKTQGTDLDDANGKSSSSSPGDVLGLGNYASDDDDDEDKEVQNSSIPSSTSSRPTVHLAVNGSSQVDDGKVPDKKFLKEESDSHGVGPNGATDDYNDNSSAEKVKPDNSDVSKSKQSVRGTDAGKHELPVKGGLNTENAVSDDAQVRSPRNGVDKNDNKWRSSSKNYNGEVESGKDKKRMKADENSKIQDEKHIMREKKDDQNGSKEKLKERDLEKRVSKNEIKDDKKERDRDRRSHAKEDDRKRERKDEKNEKKHKRERSSSPGRHKRDRSLSPGRHRNSKDNSSVSRAHGSSDSSSSDSRRKVRSKRRDRSPSPVRSRRQVSRSPPSKRSQHRHSNYSSLESTRERRRSRSRTRR
nr:hypothetical protein [Tanacetum cinerariifolium]